MAQQSALDLSTQSSAQGASKAGRVMVVVVLALVGLVLWRSFFVGSVSPNIVAFSNRVEGEYSAVAPTPMARIQEVRVREGENIKGGDVRERLKQPELAVDQSNDDAQRRVALAEADLTATEPRLVQPQDPIGTAAPTPPAPEPHVTVVVDTQTSISPYDLASAGREVTRILGAIGVSTDWMVEEPLSHTAPCHSAKPVASGFVVRPLIVTQGPEPFVPGEAVLGRTPPGHHDSGAGFQVFYDTIHEFARAQGKAESAVLALVIAHEIGHLLLPEPAHADAGIMRTPWDGDALDGLMFTAREGELIRQRLTP